MNDFGLLVAQYNSSLPTLTDGNYTELQVDVNGRLLVQADVSVVIDFLGLNGAGDSSNVLMVGTEDGTSGGTAHAVRLDTGGQVIISDGGGSITVDGSVTVSATDLDIRDLSAAQDNVAISDGTDTLAINADGSINISDNGGSITVDSTDFDIRDLTAASDSVSIGDGTDTLAINADGSINTISSAPGNEEFASSDNAADGIVAVTTTYTTVATISVGAGETLYIYGWHFAADKNTEAKLVVRDSGVDADLLKVALNSSAMPSYQEHFADQGRIEIAGAASRTVEVMVKTRGGTGNASASINARKIV